MTPQVVDPSGDPPVPAMAADVAPAERSDLDADLAHAVAAGVISAEDAASYQRLCAAAAHGQHLDDADIERFRLVRGEVGKMRRDTKMAAERAAFAAVDHQERAAGATSRPQAALDARTAVVETLRSSRGHAAALRALKAMTKNFYDADDGLIDATADDVVRLCRGLGAATVFWIAPDMVDLVAHAAASMPSQPLMETDLPVPTGFIWLPFSAELCPYGPSLRAVAWQHGFPTPATVRVTWLYSNNVWALKSGGTPAPWPLFPARWDDWTLGHSYAESFAPPAADSDRDPVRPAIYGVRRFLQALWSIMAEPYISTEQRRADRAAARRAERAGLDSDIRVVTLRRAAERRDHAGGTDVDWSHRWIVQGHWRNQWYPGTSVHRQRYIAPYVKGPDDKPLKIPDIVFALRR